MRNHRFQDLTGMTFGDYEVMYEAPPKQLPSGIKNVMWHCKCIHCNDEKDIAANHIKRRPNKCPNCSKKKTTLIDLTGKTIGDVLINSRAPGKLKCNGKYTTMWNCTCLACGKEFITDKSHIDRQKSCGCVGIKRNQLRRTINFIGKKIGRLFVEKRVEDYVKPSGGRDRQWQCLCDCGERCIKTTTYLRHSKTASCGCWKNEETSKRKVKDLTGQTFHWLFVEERLPSKRTSGGNPVVMYRCKCLNCGCDTTASANALVNGTKKSCGCIISAGEMNIRQWLNEREINYSTQFHFKDLYVTKPQWPLLFDFAILNEDNELLFLIEYQGEQHYRKVDKEGKFGKQQREITDKMKKDYCYAHNISLFEIKYDEDISESLENIFTTYVNFVPSSARRRCNDQTQVVGLR